ncbi:hypothetical protein FHS84_001350 [Rhizomicrobium electricum]|nr:hypothetical protein [Rhizomicrobium electricum]
MGSSFRRYAAKLAPQAGACGTLKAMLTQILQYNT